jgi:hypothetical protein
MKITTESHGAFPTEQSLKSSAPRIAFVNSDDTDRYLRATQVSPDLLIIGADDIGEGTTLSWLSTLINVPPTLSNLVKRQVWASSRRSGFPFAPMSLGDAIALLDFHAQLQARGVEHLVISCEYGKSRSVTTSRFLRGHLHNEGQATLEPIPNPWVNQMLELALKRLLKTQGAH